jgi:DNA adenine methylase
MIKRPLLRYHGGKWRIAPWIISFFPSHRVYVELFGGGGSVLLRKGRSHEEVYNDLDSDIVNLFRVTRGNGEELRRKLALTPFSREEYVLSYRPTNDPVEKARRTDSHERKTEVLWMKNIEPDLFSCAGGGRVYMLIGFYFTRRAENV